jgi:hypothetical protein
VSWRRRLRNRLCLNANTSAERLTVGMRGGRGGVAVSERRGTSHLREGDVAASEQRGSQGTPTIAFKARKGMSARKVSCARVWGEGEAAGQAPGRWGYRGDNDLGSTWALWRGVDFDGVLTLHAVVHVSRVTWCSSTHATSTFPQSVFARYVTA